MTREEKQRRRYAAGRAAALGDWKHGVVAVPSSRDESAWAAGYGSVCDELRDSFGPDWRTKGRIET